MPSQRALLLMLCGSVTAYVLGPFLEVLLWAGGLSIILWPLTSAVQRCRVPRVPAAILTTVGATVLIVAPASVLLSSLGGELARLSEYIQQANSMGMPAPHWLEDLPIVGKSLVAWWQDNLAVPGGLQEALRHYAGSSVPTLTAAAKIVTAAVFSNVLYVFLTGLSLLVILINKETVVTWCESVGNELWPYGFRQLSEIVPVSLRATFFGLGSVALLEGVVLGIAYAIAGAPFPVLFAVLTGYLALIPGGAPFSFSAVSLVLLAQGHGTEAAGLFAWGSIELFLVDKFVRPVLIGRQVHLPFLAVLLGLLGGLAMLGPMGLFAGPLVVAMLFRQVRQVQSQA